MQAAISVKLPQKLLKMVAYEVKIKDFRFWGLFVPCRPSRVVNITEMRRKCYPEMSMGAPGIEPVTAWI